jgi:hypothetical protein
MDILENTLSFNRNILLLDTSMDYTEIEYLKKHFCGLVYDINKLYNIDTFNDYLLYLTGNIEEINLPKNNSITIYIIKQLSYNIYLDHEHEIIDIKSVPINIHNVGVFIEQFFDPNINYFKLIENEHKFQNLTESNKDDIVFRTGIYLSRITKQSDDNLKFNILRCSSNLDGPTESFRETDNEIINSVNHIASYFFDQKTNLNHVLVQIYENIAMIENHSDKTADMPRNGLIAFCSFYRDYDTNRYKSAECLTKMRFKLKAYVKDDTELVKQFDIILYPNSVFLISLWTNRLYTHEIVQNNLPSEKIPTRLEYVIRCSNREVIYNESNGGTYIIEDDMYRELIEPTLEDMYKLKELYFCENVYDKIMDYDDFYFSLNKGDYMKPIV